MFIKAHSMAILALRRLRVSVGIMILLACGLATVSAADCGSTGSVVCSRQGGMSAAQVGTWQDRNDAERARLQAALAKEEARLNKESKERRKIQEMQSERERQDRVNRDNMQQQLQRNMQQQYQRNLNNNGRK